MNRMPDIEIDKPDALVDEPIALRATGYRPGQVLELEACRHRPDGGLWRRACSGRWKMSVPLRNRPKYPSRSPFG